MLGMTMDNASNNDTLLYEIPSLLPSTATVGNKYQIRCFAHILNLCCKAFLSLYDSSKKALRMDGVAQVAGPTSGSDGDSDVEEDEVMSDGEDGTSLVEDQAADRDDGDWEQIEDLCHSLTEVSWLSAADKEFGHTTIKKVLNHLILWFVSYV
ncbi:hypothetical protein BDP27DRAFT_1229706 [Rhodocollybia butyracea]|uniref:Uncharacterized protein n=1 Tax=Rhodocollybia butyracea TaxID=206335 RepID=A0A9P5PK55_9AGAR|nr:hypothetical protein BDP27DRAFT_1229706 [Rhodocollybia butyracea]